MPDITMLQIVNEIRRIAAESPERMYEPTEDGNCVYVERVSENSYKKSCIVGHALVNLGISPKDLDFSKATSAIEAFNALGIETKVHPGDFKRSEWISVVQECQDLSSPWAYAIQEADRWVDEMELDELDELS